MPKFKIGDKIVINNNVKPEWWFKPGMKGVINALDGNLQEKDGLVLNVIFKGKDHRGLDRRGYITEDMADLEEEVPAARLGNFVFCSEGGKYYARKKFASLEAAEAYAQRLRRLNGNNNIHPFVMVT